MKRLVVKLAPFLAHLFLSLQNPSAEEPCQDGVMASSYSPASALAAVLPRAPLPPPPSIPHSFRSASPPPVPTLLPLADLPLHAELSPRPTHQTTNFKHQYVFKEYFGDKGVKLPAAMSDRKVANRESAAPNSIVPSTLSPPSRLSPPIPLPRPPSTARPSEPSPLSSPHSVDDAHGGGSEKRVVDMTNESPPKQSSQQEPTQVSGEAPHHGRNFFKCPDCPTIFDDYARFMAHKQRHHGVGSYTASFPKGLLGQEQEVAKIFPCPFQPCASVFPRADLLDRHVRRHHISVASFDHTEVPERPEGLVVNTSSASVVTAPPSKL